MYNYTSNCIHSITYLLFYLTAPTNLPFLVLGATEGVEQTTLPASDDATSVPIYITGGLPLGSATHTVAHVSHSMNASTNIFRGIFCTLH